MSAFYLQKDSSRANVLANVISFLSRLPDTKVWKVDITEFRKARTDPQNHALFGLAYPTLSEATGFTKDELHEAFCRRFFGTVEREVMGKVIERPYRTTTTGPDGRRDVISWDQFSEFYAMVEQVAAEAGVFIAPPDPFWKEKSREAA
jgi:hypothetical protein